MKDIPIRNEELIALLNEACAIANLDMIKNLALSKQEKRKKFLNQEFHVGEEYRTRIVDMGQRHDGFPEHLDAFNLNLGGGVSEAEVESQINQVGVDLYQRVLDVDKKIQTFIGTRNNALFTVYPPGGYISWHNNANAPGYNVIFTWSEKGEGYWQHIDPITKEVVTIPDVIGWQCKSGYYGHYGQKDELIYHCAATNCWRMTIAFVFNKSEMGEEMSKMALEDISNTYK